LDHYVLNKNTFWSWFWTLLYPRARRER